MGEIFIGEYNPQNMDRALLINRDVIYGLNSYM